MTSLLLFTSLLFTVPRAPQIDVSSCVVCDNDITVAWQPAGEAEGDGERIERYELEYRKTNRDNSLRAAGDACWEKILDISDTRVTISGEVNIPISLSGALC